MGWTVYYRGEADTSITDDERKILESHQQEWARKLMKGSEPYHWQMEDGGNEIKGFTKVEFSEDSQADFVTVIRATQDLERLLPRFRFLVSDDYVVTTDTRPSDVEPD